MYKIKAWFFILLIIGGIGGLIIFLMNDRMEQLEQDNMSIRFSSVGQIVEAAVHQELYKEMAQTSIMALNSSLMDRIMEFRQYLQDNSIKEQQKQTKKGKKIKKNKSTKKATKKQNNKQDPETILKKEIKPFLTAGRDIALFDLDTNKIIFKTFKKDIIFPENFITKITRENLISTILETPEDLYFSSAMKIRHKAPYNIAIILLRKIDQKWLKTISETTGAYLGIVWHNQLRLAVMPNRIKKEAEKFSDQKGWFSFGDIVPLNATFLSFLKRKNIAVSGFSITIKGNDWKITPMILFDRTEFYRENLNLIILIIVIIGVLIVLAILVIMGTINDYERILKGFEVIGDTIYKGNYNARFQEELYPGKARKLVKLYNEIFKRMSVLSENKESSTGEISIAQSQTEMQQNQVESPQREGIAKELFSNLDNLEERVKEGSSDEQLPFDTSEKEPTFSEIKEESQPELEDFIPDSNATVMAKLPEELISKLTQSREEVEAEKFEKEADYKIVFDRFVKAKKEAGEDVSGLNFEKFKEKLQKTEESIKKQYNCSKVVFDVVVKGNKVSLKAKPIKE